MNKVTHIFGQILQLFPRAEFTNLVKQTKAAVGTKGFACWDQFVAMLFCQLGRAQSLREICYGLATSGGKLQHLGMQKAPSRSTLAYANAHRPWQLYQQVFYQLLERCRATIGSTHKFRFKNPLLSFDATLIDVCLSLFDWAKYRRTKGALKLHLLLDHAGYLPQFVHLTDGKTHEVKVLQKLELAPDTIVAMDRGLVDYTVFGRWTDQGVYFVTRLKRNADYTVVERRTLPQNRPAIRRDEIIRLQGSESQKKCPHDLRIIEVWVEDKQDSIILLTNHLEFGATTIAAIYKDRWQIELFFKALKQNLRIKTFVGTSKNAVLIQIWTALIAILILKYLKAKSTFAWSLSNLVAMLRFHLLTYKDIWTWLDTPYFVPEESPKGTQLSVVE